jgi:hypothetical protein
MEERRRRMVVWTIEIEIDDFVEGDNGNMKIVWKGPAPTAVPTP